MGSSLTVILQFVRTTVVQKVHEYFKAEQKICCAVYLSGLREGDRLPLHYMNTKSRKRVDNLLFQNSLTDGGEFHRVSVLNHKIQL